MWLILLFNYKPLMGNDVSSRVINPFLMAGNFFLLLLVKLRLILSNMGLLKLCHILHLYIPLGENYILDFSSLFLRHRYHPG